MGVPDISDSSDGYSYSVIEIYTPHVAQVTGHIPFLPPGLNTLNMATYTHQQSITCVTVFVRAGVMQWLFKQHLVMFMPFYGRVRNFTFPLLLYIGSHSHPIYVSPSDVVTYYNRVFAWIHHFPLHLLRHYRILQVWNMLTNLHTL